MLGMADRESYREISKRVFGREKKDSAAIDEINCGSLQRIADAAESMARNYLQLQADVTLYKRWYEESQKQIAGRDRTISALRGQITKLKNAKGGVQ